MSTRSVKSSRSGASSKGSVSTLRKSATVKHAQAARRTAADSARGVVIPEVVEDVTSPIKAGPEAQNPEAAPSPPQQEPDAEQRTEILPQDQDTERIRKEREEEEAMDRSIAVLEADIGAMERATYTDEEWSEAASDATSIRSGRVSMLPPYGTMAGVAKDLASERATELFQAGKSALERAGNMKRECRVEAHDAMNALYQLTLNLADSRHRHRMNLEKERTRAARELVRVERAHNREIAKSKEVLESVKAAVEKTTELAESVLRWLNFEMDSPIRTIETVHREVKALSTSVSTRLSSVAETGAPLADQGPQMAKLEAGMRDLTSQMRAIQLDVERWRAEGERVLAETKRNLSPERRPQPQTPSAELAALIGEVREMRETLRSHMGAQALPAPPSIAEIRNELDELTRPIANMIRTVREEVAEVRDLSLVETAPHNVTVGLGAEINATETKAMVEETVRPIFDRLGALTSEVRTYAQALRTVAAPPCLRGPAAEECRPNPSTRTRRSPPGNGAATTKTFGLMVESVDPRDTGDDVANALKSHVDVISLGVGVDGLRKIRNGRVVVNCSTQEGREVLEKAIRDSQPTLTVARASERDPKIRLLGVAHHLTDDQVAKALLSQNPTLLQEVPEGCRGLKVLRRVKGRTDALSNVIVEVSPHLWRALAGKRVRIGYQTVAAVDQSPVAQCYRCLGFGHHARTCQATDGTCGYCAERHDTRLCPNRAATPCCANCEGRPAHPAYSQECPIWKKWDRIARASVRYC